MSNHLSTANLQFPGDVVALMDALGHQRFAMYGTDTRMSTAYALAADHPGRLDYLIVSFDKPSC